MIPDWLKRFVVIDVETTGLSPHSDRIIELGYALYARGRWEKIESFYVSPQGRHVSDEICALTNIRREDVLNAPEFFHVWNAAASDLYGAMPIAYNAAFDKAFLHAAVARTWPRHAFQTLPWCLDAKARWIDVIGLVPKWLPGSRKLGNVASQLGFADRNLHRAAEDARLAGAILLKVLHDTSAHDNWDWSYPSTTERMQKTLQQRTLWKFYRGQKELGEQKAWLPQGQPIRLYECDLCHRLEPGRFTKSGWTPPLSWCTYGLRGEVAACGPACDLSLRWHGLVG